MTIKESLTRDLDRFYGRRWDKPNNLSEVSLVQELARAIGGNTEVCTPVGRIDLLRNDLILEAKKPKLFKGAIGQLLAYGIFYEREHRAIGIIGPMPKYCPEVCETLGLLLLHYDYNSYRWYVY